MDLNCLFLWSLFLSNSMYYWTSFPLCRQLQRSSEGGGGGGGGRGLSFSWLDVLTRISAPSPWLNRLPGGESAAAVRGGWAGRGMRADRAAASSPCSRPAPAVHFIRLYEPMSAGLSVSWRRAAAVCSPGDDNIGQRLAAATRREWKRSQNGPHRQGPGFGYPVRRCAHLVAHQLCVPEKRQPLLLL